MNIPLKNGGVSKYNLEGMTDCKSGLENVQEESATSCNTRQKRSYWNDVTEPVIKGPPPNRMPRPDDFMGEFYQTFKKDLILILLNLQKNRKGNTSKFILWGNITLRPKPDKDTTKRKLLINILDEHRCKNSQ